MRQVSTLKSEWMLSKTLAAVDRRSVTAFWISSCQFLDDPIPTNLHQGSMPVLKNPIVGIIV